MVTVVKRVCYSLISYQIIFRDVLIQDMKNEDCQSNCLTLQLGSTFSCSAANCIEVENLNINHIIPTSSMLY